MREIGAEPVDRDELREVEAGHRSEHQAQRDADGGCARARP